jgi:hypothetical protein
MAPKKINKFDLQPQMPPKKKPKCNISGLLNQKTTIPAIDASHEDDIPSGRLRQLINAARSEY